MMYFRTAVLMSLAIATLNPAYAGKKDEIKAIKGLMQEWVDSGDKQDAALAAKLTHAATVHYVTGERFENGLRVVNSEQYAALLEGKKIGGQERKLKIHSVQIDDLLSNAVARIELTSAKATFYQFVALSKIGAGEWKIMSVLSSVKLPQS